MNRKKMHEFHSQILYDLGIQAHQSWKQGDISRETCRELLQTINRAHCKVLVDSGELTKMRQFYYNRRNPSWVASRFAMEYAILASAAIITCIAWVIV